MKNPIRMLIGAAVALLALAGAITFGIWRYDKYRHMPPPAQAVILRDRSDSNLGGCDDMAAMGQELLLSSPFTKGSAIALMVTGDGSTADEPVLLDVLEVPTTQRAMEGRSTITQRRQALVERIKGHCVQAGQTKQSPIYMAIRRAVEYERANGCDGLNKCTVYVQSDLEELSEKSIKEDLNGRPLLSRKISQSLPTPIDNRGIDVKVCGLSETAGAIVSTHKPRTLTPKHDAERVDRIRSVWEKMFSDPERVVFSSHCPKGQP